MSAAPQSHGPGAPAVGRRVPGRANDADDFAAHAEPQLPLLDALEPPGCTSAAPPTREGVILEFLRGLIGDLPDGLFAYVWTDADHISAYFDSLGTMAAYAARRASGSNVILRRFVDQPAIRARPASQDRRRPYAHRNLCAVGRLRFHGRGPRETKPSA